MSWTFGVIRFFFLLAAFVIGIQYPSIAFGDDGRVYLEPDCLNVLGASKKHQIVENGKDANQTFVEEDRGYIAFDRVTVIEKRDNAITESYTQVRNCRLVKSDRSAD